jgi:hypothetical protein
MSINPGMVSAIASESVNWAVQATTAFTTNTDDTLTTPI